MYKHETCADVCVHQREEEADGVAALPPHLLPAWRTLGPPYERPRCSALAPSHILSKRTGALCR